MYEVISYKDSEKWEQRISEISPKDVFYRHSYSCLYQKMGDGDPHLFYYDNGKGNKLCYTFLKRRINELPFMIDRKMDEALFDIITPSYGYGGPLYDVEDMDLIREFRSEFDHYCKKENIITEFIRFHPLLQNQRGMDHLMEITYDRETVFFDLRKSEDEIFNHYHKNHKRNVLKAQKHNLEFKVFASEDRYKHLEEFYQLYKETMDKLNASAYSYFSVDYLQNLLRGFEQNSIIGAVFHDNKMVAAAICMYEGGSLHYHLGCSEKEFLNLGSTIFLLHHLALWGKGNGMYSFHLGGGHIGRDSLFQFKYRFNPSGTLDFYIGKKVHLPEMYKKLIHDWEQYYLIPSQEKFFPSYRYQVKRDYVPIVVK